MFVEFHARSFDDTVAAYGHRVARIHRYIHQYLVNQAQVRVNEQWLRRKLEFHPDVLDWQADLEADHSKGCC